MGWTFAGKRSLIPFVCFATQSIFPPVKQPLSWRVNCAQLPNDSLARNEVRTAKTVPLYLRKKLIHAVLYPSRKARTHALTHFLRSLSCARMHTHTHLHGHAYAHTCPQSRHVPEHPIHKVPLLKLGPSQVKKDTAVELLVAPPSPMATDWPVAPPSPVVAAADWPVVVAAMVTEAPAVNPSAHKATKSRRLACFRSHRLRTEADEPTAAVATARFRRESTLLCLAPITRPVVAGPERKRPPMLGHISLPRRDRQICGDALWPVPPRGQKSRDMSTLIRDDGPWRLPNHTVADHVALSAAGHAAARAALSEVWEADVEATKAEPVGATVDRVVDDILGCVAGHCTANPHAASAEAGRGVAPAEKGEHARNATKLAEQQAGSEQPLFTRVSGLHTCLYTCSRTFHFFFHFFSVHIFCPHAHASIYTLVRTLVHTPIYTLVHAGQCSV